MMLRKISEEIREILDEKRKSLDLSFIEEDHIYYMRNLDGEIRNDFPSVSKVMKLFYEEFDSEGISFKKAKGDLEVQQQLLKEWKGAADYSVNMGSRVHYFLEKRIIERFGDYKDVRQPIFECDFEQTLRSDAMISAGTRYIDLMVERGGELLDTEIVLGDPTLGYVGQPDKVWLFENNEKTDYGLVITDWKGLPVDTPIFTNSGWKTMGTLSKDDKVYDMNGELTEITNISGVKHKKCYKIMFDNKEEIVADFEHRWLITFIDKGIINDVVLTTQELYEHLGQLKKRYVNKIPRVKISKPLNNQHIELPIDPYVLGVWLGDGHSADAKITNMYSEIWDEIEKRGYEIGNDVSGNGVGKAQTKTIFGLQAKLRENGLLKNKHIPSIYLLSSIEQRIDLLRGFMDSDGYYNKPRNRFSMETTREWQKDALVMLLGSLGIKSSVSRMIKKLNGKKIPAIAIGFNSVEFNPFLCRNKDVVNIKKIEKFKYKYIISIEEVETVPTRCIEVKSDTKTFLYGHTFAITHNTNKKKNFEASYFTKKMYRPFQKLDNTALGHYFTQLPFYGKLLLKMLEGTKYENIKLYGCIVVHVDDNGGYEEYRVPKDVINTIMDMNITDHLKKLKK